MTIHRKALGAQTETLAEKRQVRVICSAPEIDRAGEVVVQEGIDLSAYLTNPVVLWQHDPEQPIARAVEIGVVGGKLQALVQFPPEGTSAKSDEVYGLVKAGVINATSIGFEPKDMEPMDPKKPYGAQKYLSCELMEFSFVSVPAVRGATVVERAAHLAKSGVLTADDVELIESRYFSAEEIVRIRSSDPVWKVGASRSLPLGDDGEWDGPAAAARILDWAGFSGDEPDSVKARKGFLTYDSANPDLKGSYKLPFADIIDGELKAMPAGIRAAASRLPQTDIPDDVATKARAVLDHYEGKMKTDKQASLTVTIPAGISETSLAAQMKAWEAARAKGMPIVLPKGWALAAPKRASASKVVVKGLWQVGVLARLLADLGWLQDDVQWEADIEQDGSTLPQQLGEAMMQLGQALVDMAQEEVAELLADLQGVGEEVDEAMPMDDGDMAYVTAGKTPALRKFRAGWAKAGRVLSAKNETDLKQARELIDGVVSQVETEEQKAADKDRRTREFELLKVRAL